MFRNAAHLFPALAFACLICGGVGYSCYCEWVEPGPGDDLTLLCILAGADRRPRRANTVRDRLAPLNEVATWSDEFFRRQYRITRAEFALLREALLPHLRPRSVAMGNVGSGGIIPVDTKILITLRMMAGAMYLDMVWYRVAVNHVNEYMMEIVEAMNSCAYLDNINLPKTEAEVRRVQSEWDAVSKIKHGCTQIEGTIGAVDGYQTAIRRPSNTECEAMGVNPDAFFYRKGFFAVLACGVCDAYGQFMYWGMRNPGATNDIVAYEQTGLKEEFAAGKPMSAGHFVMDEAYACIGGNHHLCPYSKHQLTAARRANDMERLDSMLVFNNRLSSQRITVERAFGMLLRRWGMFWHDMAYTVADTISITTACVRLHNLCILRWRAQHGNSPIVADGDGPLVPPPAAAFEAEGLGRARPDAPGGGDVDARVEVVANGVAPAPGARVRTSPRREELRRRLWDMGYTIHADRHAAAMQD